jgi:hypothetical protein
MIIYKELNGSYMIPSCMPMPWIDLKDSLLETNNINDENTNDSNENMQLQTITTTKSYMIIPSNINEMELDTSLIGLGKGANVQDRRNQSLDEIQSVLSQSTVWLGLRYQLFDIESAPTAESFLNLTPLEKHIISDYYCDTLRLFEPMVCDDGTLVGSIELLCKHLLSLSKLFTSPIRLEFALVEVLLLQLIQIPSRRPALVVRVILELCRIMPELPPALATGDYIIHYSILLHIYNIV